MDAAEDEAVRACPINESGNKGDCYYISSTLSLEDLLSVNG